uniref:Zinc finger, FYVE domain containing 9b n=1 Tax=Gasterosteus aculeatus aculeatus TaxID=481459 RepID=G3PDW7_GASAC
MGDCAASPPDPDNELSPAGILSKDRGAVLGEVAPVWVPDAQAQVCMKCGVKFTFTKRRHHCRACGKVFCALCSNLKFRLTHLDGKEGRVCVSCHSTLDKRTPPRGRRRVWFADDILPSGQSESAPTSPVRGASPLMRRALGGLVGSPVSSPQTRRASRPHRTGANEACGPYGWGTAALVGSSANLIPLEGLPPILTSTGVKGDYTVEEQPSEMLLIQELESGRPKPLVFVLNANLLAMVKLVNYVNRKCWCVTTKGMHAVGQAEVVLLLQCLPEEKSFPKDIFSHIIQLYRDALTGKVVKHPVRCPCFGGGSFLGRRGALRASCTCAPPSSPFKVCLCRTSRTSLACWSTEQRWPGPKPFPCASCCDWGPNTDFTRVLCTACAQGSPCLGKLATP